VFGNTGLSATPGKGPTLDVVDTYRKISDRRPLVAEIWPLRDFFEMAINPTDHLKKIRSAGKKGKAVHLFQNPPSRAEVRKYSGL